MLEVGTDVVGGESAPGEVLVHGVGLVGPLGEAVGVEGDVGLEALGGLLVGEEEHGAGGALEHVHARAGALPLLLVLDNIAKRAAGKIPQLIVLGAKQHNSADGLRVEGRRRSVEGLLDDGLDVSGSGVSR